jgi:hypothetical protein
MDGSYVRELVLTRAAVVGAVFSKKKVGPAVFWRRIDE